MKTFDYCKPSSLSEAAKMLSADGARALAGGHTLLPTMKQRLDSPSVVVDLSAVPELASGVSESGGALTVGRDDHATRTVASNRATSQKAPSRRSRSLANGISAIAHVRYRGTIGGIDREQRSGGRLSRRGCIGACRHHPSPTVAEKYAADDFFTGPVFETALEPRDD